ncbi:LuxR C-terminal-related transcriptional regulator [Devosia sp.]|uniref:helix-turn-helix transcriptional regulator n=1 Tax=Devosia sp. TaxID=1871048 RepID=UPI0019F0F0BD|nr:LuxR C-terminal-related transcriptional regulator [Devosia sp.]MBE0580097.1 helix-turn-helix transcriptional regulator [Devosia sp.]
MPSNTISRSASARAAERVWQGAKGIHLVLDDDALGAALRLALSDRADLVETGPDDASVVITDRDLPDFSGAARDRVLRVGPGSEGRNGIDAIEPSLILSAGAVIAAGYAIEPVATEASNPDRAPIHLSHREHQVAALLVDGASNKLIVRQLDISVHTAKFHVTAVLDKLGARNRADAVALILREGLVAL